MIVVYVMIHASITIKWGIEMPGGTPWTLPPQKRYVQKPYVFCNASLVNPASGQVHSNMSVTTRGGRIEGERPTSLCQRVGMLKIPTGQIQLQKCGSDSLSGLIIRSGSFRSPSTDLGQRSWLWFFFFHVSNNG